MKGNCLLTATAAVNADPGGGVGGGGVGLQILWLCTGGAICVSIEMPWARGPVLIGVLADKTGELDGQLGMICTVMEVAKRKLKRLTWSKLLSYELHRKKNFSIFPCPAGMWLSLGGNNLYMTSLFPPRESLVSDIPAGDGNIEKLFYGVLLTLCSCCEDISSHKSHQSSLVVAIESTFAVSVCGANLERRAERIE